MAIRENSKLRWKDDIPYYHVCTRTYTCHHGRDGNIYQKKKYAQIRDAKVSRIAYSIHLFYSIRYFIDLNCKQVNSLESLEEVTHSEYTEGSLQRIMILVLTNTELWILIEPLDCVSVIQYKCVFLENLPLILWWKYYTYAHIAPFGASWGDLTLIQVN